MRLVVFLVLMIPITLSAEPSVLQPRTGRAASLLSGVWVMTALMLGVDQFGVAVTAGEAIAHPQSAWAEPGRQVARGLQFDSHLALEDKPAVGQGGRITRLRSLANNGDPQA